jgi:hypothetical protein
MLSIWLHIWIHIWYYLLLELQLAHLDSQCNRPIRTMEHRVPTIQRSVGHIDESCPTNGTIWGYRMSMLTTSRPIFIGNITVRSKSQVLFGAHWWSDRALGREVPLHHRHEHLGTYCQWEWPASGRGDITLMPPSASFVPGERFLHGRSGQDWMEWAIPSMRVGK